MDSAERIGDVGGQWSEKFSPYFERLSFWNLLSLERFEHAFALRTLIEESPRLIRFEFVEALEDEMEYLIYEIALSEISKSSAPQFAFLLEGLAKKLSKRGASELASSVNEARLGVLGEPEGH